MVDYASCSPAIYRGLSHHPRGRATPSSTSFRLPTRCPKWSMATSIWRHPDRPRSQRRRIAGRVSTTRRTRRPAGNDRGATGYQSWLRDIAGRRVHIGRSRRRHCHHPGILHQPGGRCSGRRVHLYGQPADDDGARRGADPCGMRRRRHAARRPGRRAGIAGKFGTPGQVRVDDPGVPEPPGLHRVRGATAGRYWKWPSSTACR